MSRTDEGSLLDAAGCIALEPRGLGFLGFLYTNLTGISKGNKV